MDELLSPVSRTYYKGSEQPLLQKVTDTQLQTPASSTTDASSVDDIIQVLSNQPDYDAVISALKLFARDGRKLKDFDIASSGPQAARIIQILVSEITPNYWTLLKESSTEDSHQDVGLLLDALRNLAGVNALLLRIRQCIQEKKGENAETKRPDIALDLNICLEVLGAVLEGDDRISGIWRAISDGHDPVRQRILSKELVAVLGGGRVVSLSAEAAGLVPREGQAKNFWTADGAEYSQWLTRNIIASSKREDRAEQTQLLANLLSKSMSLGYPSTVTRTILTSLINTPQDDESFRFVFGALPASQQRAVLFSTIKNLADVHLNGLDDLATPANQAIISSAAGIIKKIVAEDPKNTSHLIAWLTSATGAGLGDAIEIRRAVLAVLASSRDNIATVFEKSLAQFGDYLYIRHTPILQQEVHAQVLLLSAGYLQRLSPFKLAMQVKGGPFMNMISKRLEASQTRARLLGMIVGEALSDVVEKSDKRLEFKMDETKSEEAQWYKSLVDVCDTVGPIDPLRSTQQQQASNVKIENKPFTRTKPESKRFVPTSTAKAIIEEIDSDEEMEDDIVPLKRPDDDEEDSDDDPEVVRRDRPKAPVYIRNLISYLRDTENYDRQKLALTTAPPLIRRKANFGTEVKEHAEELATLLVGLQDKFEIDDFDDLKLQGMIAIVVAQPQKMGPWFAKTVFDGDFSVAQRVSVLAVLGLGARELAGIITSDYATAASFPSKILPDRMKKLYVGDDDATDSGSPRAPSKLKALPPNALDTISQALTSEFMAPIAANAADASTGPDVLKLSTFTSRLQSKQSTMSKGKSKPRVRAIPNTTAQLVATSFFFPLTARFQSAIHSSASRARGIIFQPILLSLYLKTLALLLHAAGPSTLSLPDMTTELWGILLGSSVRAHAVGDLGVTKAVLFALLTMLEVNSDRMRDIYQSMSREVIETQEWVVQVFHGLRGEDSSGEEAEAKALAAGCLIRLNEGSEKYRMLLMGDMLG